MITNNMRPIHPGEILREEYTLPLGLRANRLARDLRVPVTRISKILNEERAITPDTRSGWLATLVGMHKAG
jgi:addiction module HigA family antidote